ncbi:MAG: glycosyl hydrolase family 18 [Tessaracoccus sp.]|uniref:chitinase n=1 Tax=Tessaracoccus sp. TaxID=1971211 RepID=UPI001EB90992|nr:carbohydrate-binding protein [Tessaracoccus sp.]MBK7821980.1 glycosyl hydrolase family 18 [Tessaracoccus sp.]
MSKRFPGRRLSPFRATLLLMVVAALAGSGVYGVGWWRDAQAAEGSEPWFAAYVDATATPAYPFEAPAAATDGNVVLSFIVAAGPGRCEASWGGYYSPDEAQEKLDLDRRIARLRQSNGEVVLSLGGQANSELALECDTVDELSAEYARVVERYQPAAMDLDIEGPALADVASRTRRAQAVADLQASLDHHLPVWLTLPVGPDGLTPDGVATVQAFLEAGVRLDGVNIMTMNFANAEAATDQSAVAIASLRATHRQLVALYADRGKAIGSMTAWRMIGATPMIGQNDVTAEVFTLDDARRLRAFAEENQLGRLSMWSANRDASCAPAYVDLSVVSDSCSGVNQGEELFATILGTGFDGAPAGGQGVGTAAPTVRPEEITDDPATSPYPIWDRDASYPAETRVVWRRNVYEAKWWSTNSQPDDPRVAPADSPWRLIGPVLPGEKPLPQLSLPDDFYAAWDPKEIYVQGQRVMLDGIAFEAKWWTQGDNPASGQADPGSSPWRTLTQEEIGKLLEG